MSETQKIMKMVTTWGHKTDHKYLTKKSDNFLEKNYETKMQEETVFVSTCPHDFTYMKPKQFFQILP